MASTKVITLMILSLSGCMTLRLNTGHTDGDQKQLKVAYAVFVTDIRNTEMKNVLAVTSYGLKQAAQKSRHNVETIALVPDRMPESHVQFLKTVGFAKVIKKPLPVQISEIDPVKGAEVISQFKRSSSADADHQFTFADETIKYWPLTLTEYDRVLMLDADVMVLDPMDELLERKEDFVGTYDHGLDGSWNSVPPVQGGFLLYRPKVADFEEIKRLTKTGEFCCGRGWFQSGIGWNYGGTGPDGMLAYYFHKDALDLIKTKGKANILDGQLGTNTKGVRMYAADRAKYDVVFAARLSSDLKDRDPEEIAKGMKSVHFTGDCPKPWQCGSAPEKLGGLRPVCDKMIHQWFTMRTEMEKSMDLTPSKGCIDGRYNGIKKLEEI